MAYFNVFTPLIFDEEQQDVVVEAMKLAEAHWNKVGNGSRARDCAFIGGFISDAYRIVLQQCESAEDVEEATKANEDGTSS